MNLLRNGSLFCLQTSDLIFRALCLQFFNLILKQEECVLRQQYIGGMGKNMFLFFWKNYVKRDKIRFCHKVH